MTILAAAYLLGLPYVLDKLNKAHAYGESHTISHKHATSYACLIILLPATCGVLGAWSICVSLRFHNASLDLPVVFFTFDIANQGATITH